jgi:hypothetical protein
MELGEKGWDEFFAENITDLSLQGSIIPLILTSANSPQHLLNQAVQNLNDTFAERVWVASLQGRIPDEHLLLLLKHNNKKIAFAAATGEWSNEPKGVIKPSLRTIWEEIIIHCNIEDMRSNNFELSQILAAEPDLSIRWLENFLQDNNRLSYMFREPIKASLASLTLEARLEILEQVPNKYGFDTLILDLVNRSPDIYKYLLALPHLKDYHLSPLLGDLNDAWIELATLASNAGYTPDDIATATLKEHPDKVLNMDGEADRWSKWIKEFERIASQDNDALKRIGEAGMIIAKKRFDDNQNRLRSEAIYGW